MYDHLKIEKEIQSFWRKDDTYYFDVNSFKKKLYVLDMFPYPSGSGLHVGHPKGYTATDIYSRFKRFQGFNVLHPIGWDAFGLPAEQYAISTGNHPATFTQKNIATFRKQLQSLGLSFDYKKEVDTTDPKYYKWTQWIFCQLFKHGLAELRDVEVNWCEKLHTALANEEILIENGVMVSERGSYPIVKKKMKQWVLKITKYADRLIDDLKLTNWPDSLKSIQTNWIGKSYGTNVIFKTTAKVDLTVFTTRVDTIFGVTFIAIAPENTILSKIIASKYKASVNQYIESTKRKSLLQRQETKIKTGVFTGCYAINPVNGKKIPIYVADYVLNDYATGMVMGVASCDKRDFDFAKQNKLEIIKIIDTKEECCEGDGKHINSDFANGLNNKEAAKIINRHLTKINAGSITSNFKLKDWIFSRQRYWGEPFPIIFDENNKAILVEDLPLTIPFCENITPTNDGQSPLANLKDWVNIEKGNKKYRRETNTMPQWAGSCWYYLAYLLKQDDGSYLPLNSLKAKEIFKKWLPVDLYVGGQEHAVLHLLYARFWHKFLYDIKVVSCKEPFYKLINQGMILGPNGEKMSKSRGNVINPNDIVKKYGADTLRLYEMFMGPITATLPWSEKSLSGCRKWLDRVYNLFVNQPSYKSNQVSDMLNKAYNVFVNDVTKNLEDYKFNVAISNMMVYINACYKDKQLYLPHAKNFLVVLSCFAPFLAEYLYQFITKKSTSVTKENWPSIDKTSIKSETISLPIQINGKVRSVIVIKTNLSQNKIVTLAKKDSKIIKFLKNNTIKKTIYVKNKILNFII